MYESERWDNTILSYSPLHVAGDCFPMLKENLSKLETIKSVVGMVSCLQAAGRSLREGEDGGTIIQATRSGMTGMDIVLHTTVSKALRLRTAACNLPKSSVPAAPTPSGSSHPKRDVLKVDAPPASDKGKSLGKSLESGKKIIVAD